MRSRWDAAKILYAEAVNGAAEDEVLALDLELIFDCRPPVDEADCLGDVECHR